MGRSDPQGGGSGVLPLSPATPATAHENGPQAQRPTAQKFRWTRPQARPPASRGLFGQARRLRLKFRLGLNRDRLAQEAGQPALPGQQPLGLARHIADAALFLSSGEAEFITGEALVVDGGLMAAGPNLFGKMGADMSSFGFRGVSRGSTGEGETLY